MEGWEEVGGANLWCSRGLGKRSGAGEEEEEEGEAERRGVEPFDLWQK